MTEYLCYTGFADSLKAIQTARLSTGTLRFSPISCNISVQKPTGGVMKEAS